MGTDWHPIFETTEVEPGIWEMKGPTDYAPFGRIEIRRVDGGRQIRYRVALCDEVIGWSTSLRVACEALWIARNQQLADRRKGIPNKWDK